MTDVPPPIKPSAPAETAERTARARRCAAEAIRVPAACRAALQSREATLVRAAETARLTLVIAVRALLALAARLLFAIGP